MIKAVILSLSVILSVGNLASHAVTYKRLCRSAYLYRRSQSNTYKKLLSNGSNVTVIDSYAKRDYVLDTTGDYGFINPSSYCSK